MADTQLGPPIEHNPFEGAPTLGPPIDDPFAPPNAGAQQNVVAGSFGKPEQAATAINLSQKTGTPASVIQLNPQQHQQNYNIQQASTAVDSNPAIAKFMQKPENAAVAQGATKEMDEVSQYFQNLSQDRLNNRPYVGLFQAIPEMGRMLGTSEGRTKLLDTLVKLPVEFVKGMVNFAAVPGKVASRQIDLNTPEGMDQAISMGLGIAMFGAGKPTATGIGRDIRLGRAEDIPPEANYRSYDDFMSILRGMQTRDEINAFLKKAAGGDEATPLLMIEKASGASEALDAAVQASKEQPLRESSVAAYEEFLGSHENVQGNVHIPGQALMELYKREGKSPGPGDGLMGFIPNLAQEMKVAAETGAEVAVPMAKYVANMADKTDIHDQLKDVLRVHEDGVTLEEADAIKEAEKAKEPPPVPEGHTRWYHGGEDPTSGGGRWITPDKEYARYFRAGEQPNKVHYVDIPDAEIKTNPALAAGYDDINERFRHFEAPEEIAKKLKPLEEVAPEGQDLSLIHSFDEASGFKDFKPLSEVDDTYRYDGGGGVFGKYTYLAETPDWLRGEQGALGHNAAVKVKGQFKKLFILRPDTVDVLKKVVGETAAMSGPDIAQALISKGYDGIAVRGFGEDFEAAGIDPSILQDQVVSFAPEKNLKIIERLDFPKRPDIATASPEAMAKWREDLRAAMDKVRLDPQVQAAVDAVAKAKKGLFLRDFFEEAKALGISEANFDRFSKQLDKAKELELTRAVAVARREISKLSTPAYKRDEAAMRKQVEEELTNSPAFHADRFFNTDKGMLPNGTRVSKAAVEAMRAAPDEWAPHFGFESGKAMTDAINDLASERKAAGKGPKWQLKKRVDDEVAKRMEAKYGNLKDNIEIAASEIALENHNVDLLTTQLRMLAEANGLRPPIGREALEKMVRNEFAKLPTSGISVEKFRRAAEKAGVRTQTAFLKKDIVEAFNGVQQQRLALVFMREAKAFQKEMDKFNNNIVRLQQNRVLSGVEQRFTDQLHRLLDKLGYTNPRSEGELASALQNAPFKQFVEDHLASGAEMPVADFMLDAAWTADVGEMTVDDFRAVHESIESILHNGKAAKTIRVGNEKRDFVQTVAEAVNQVADVDPRVIAREPGLLDSLKGRLAEFDAMMLKMEQMLRWMDKRDKFGVFSQAAFRPVTEAKHVKNDLLKEIGKDIKALPKVSGIEDDVVMVNPDGTPKYPSIVDWQNGEPMTLKKKHVLMMALHSGNESNYGKLTSKYEYNNKEFQWTPADVDRLVGDVLKKGDWEHVQGWWDLFEKYWPRVEKLSRDMSGIAPDKIEAREITNKHGTWKGGYVPVGADSLWPGLKRVEKGVFNAERYFNAIPPKRYTIARTDVAYPVSLAFDNLTNTLYQMAHDLAFREPLHDASKFLDHPDVRGAIQRVLGPEYLAQVRPWLEFQAQSKRMGDDAVGALDKLAQTARQRIVTVQMLYRASTVLKHGAAAAMYSIGEVGLKDMVAESVRLWMTADGRRRVGQILEESGELRHRLHDMDRDIGEMQDRALGQSGFKASLYHWGGMGTAALDIGTAIPTYEVAFKNQLLKNPNDYQAAVYAGEAAVRDAHGSAGITDQSAIMRSSPIYKLFTIAYGTFNHNYNRTRDIGRLYKESGKDYWGGDTAAAWEKFKTATWRGLWYIFVTAMIEELIAPIPDKEGKKHGVLAWGGRALFEQLSGQLPVVRDVVRAWLHRGRPEEQTPMGQIGSSIFDAAKAAAERDFSKKMAIRKMMEGVGYLIPIPGAGQIGATAQYWEDIKMRRQTAENPYRFMRGTLLGKSHPERK